jgi:hypothetical protein
VELGLHVFELLLLADADLLAKADLLAVELDAQIDSYAIELELLALEPGLLLVVFVEPSVLGLEDVESSHLVVGQHLDFVPLELQVDSLVLQLLCNQIGVPLMLCSENPQLLP